MILGFTPFTFLHVALSLVGIVSGLIVLAGLLASQRRDGWTLVFLVTTVATNATGFAFPFFRLLPSHIIGAVSLVVLAAVMVARYVRHLAGAWRWIYAGGSVLALYLNVFVLVVQLFRRVPALSDLAPTQSEPPFALVQLAVLALFLWLGIRAVKRFHPPGVVVTLLLLLAGATSGAGAQAQPADEERRRCPPAEWPKQLPAVDAVLDSAALAAALAEAAANDSSIASTSLLFSIVYRKGGAPALRALEPLPPPPAITALMQVVSGGLLSVKAPEPAGAVRVRVRAGGGATVERSVYCPPQPAPGGMRGADRVMVTLGPGDRLPARDQRRIRTDYQTIIDEAGQVTDVRVIVGTGIRELDEHFVSEQRQRRFLPATLDGLPLASWIRSGGRSMRL